MAEILRLLKATLLGSSQPRGRDISLELERQVESDEIKKYREDLSVFVSR